MTIQITTALLIACVLGFGSSQLQHNVSEPLLDAEEKAATRSFFPNRGRVDHLRKRGMLILLTPQEARTQISIDRKGLTVSVRLER